MTAPDLDAAPGPSLNEPPEPIAGQGPAGRYVQFRVPWLRLGSHAALFAATDGLRADRRPCEVCEAPTAWYAVLEVEPLRTASLCSACASVGTLAALGALGLDADDAVSLGLAEEVG